MPSRRKGSVRQLPSGRFQARWDEKVAEKWVSHKAPHTFATKREATGWLSAQETDRVRGGWIDPDRGKETLRSYAESWIDTRPEPLGPRTAELYRGLLQRHILPQLGASELSALEPERIERWYAGLRRAGVGQVTTAKAYRLLSSILNTAAKNKRIIANPCQIEGASVEKSPEREPITVEQVYALADAVDDRYRALVLVTAFAGLRFGEAAALTRKAIDLDSRRVRITQAAQELNDGTRQIGKPKTPESVRSIAIPAQVAAALALHLEQYVDAAPDALVFTGPKGAVLRRGNFHAAVWAPAREAVALPNLHFHDLRHSGNTWAAATGASTKELMARMGHRSTRAALIYQHATEDRDAEIADKLGERIPENLASRGRLRVVS